jgi:hypothetical protein
MFKHYFQNKGICLQDHGRECIESDFSAVKLPLCAAVPIGMIGGDLISMSLEGEYGCPRIGTGAE